MIFTNVLVALAAVATVHAQNSTASSGGAVPSGVAGVSPCILSCVTAAASANNCTSFADLPCVCGSAQFQVDAGLCLQTHCTADDVTAALALQTTQCGAASITPTGTAGAPKTLSFSSLAPAATGNTTTGGNSTTAGNATTSAKSTASGTGAPATTSKAGAEVVHAAWAGIVLAGAAVGLAL